MSPEQSGSEMVEEVLKRQAKALVGRTGQPLEAALEEVADTKAGRQLRELAHSEYQERKAAEWQANLPRRRAEERHYSWLESYMERLEGKEARSKYYAVLNELTSMRG